MDANRTALLNDSNKIISKLQLLSVFFEDENIIKIHLRTQLIHKQFETNEDLDINKLELFHIQFTDTIIELLKKIKKKNENTVSAIQDEIYLNNEVIDKINHSVSLEDEYADACKAQTRIINSSLSRFYQNLSGLSKDAPFPLTISQFSIRFSSVFFHDISADLANELIAYDPTHIYSNDYGIIEKKLMGMECKMEFRNHFYTGLKSGDIVLEVYNQIAGDVYFLFYPAKKMFLLLPIAKLESINLTGGSSKKMRSIQELTDKNYALKASIEVNKRIIPTDVDQLMADYYTKISSMSFLEFMNQVDVQANILKTMLKTDSL